MRELAVPRLLLGLALVALGISTANAAEITLRPDLRGHVSELRTIYPWHRSSTAKRLSD